MQHSHTSDLIFMLEEVTWESVPATWPSCDFLFEFISPVIEKFKEENFNESAPRMFV